MESPEIEDSSKAVLQFCRGNEETLIVDCLDVDFENYQTLTGRIEQKTKAKSSDQQGELSVQFHAFNSFDKIEQVFKLMRCSLCSRTCSPDCKVCLDGHLICVGCSGFVGRCPFEIIDEFGTAKVCGSQIVGFKLKSYDALHSQIKVTMRCRFWKIGCHQILEEGALETHEEHCKFRPEHACPLTGCVKGGLNLAELVDHLVISHETQVITSVNNQHLKIHFETPPNVINYNESFSWTPAIFSCYNVNFVLSVEKFLTKIYFWFSILDSESHKPEDFQIELKLREVESDEVVVWQGAPSSFELPSEEVIKRGVALAMDSAHFMKNFIEKTCNDLVKVCVKIDRAKEGTSYT